MFGRPNPPGNVARILNPLGPLGGKPFSIPAHPFLGCIGTTSGEEPPLPSSLVNNHGGNLDHPDLVEGSSLLLPVSVAGGLLYLGDMHAAQGYGETVGGGIEISGQVTLQLELRKKANLKQPRYRTPEGIGSLATGATFEIAAQHALAGMIHWFAEASWPIHDANMLVSQVCEFRPGGLTKKYAVVSCFIAEKNVEGIEGFPL